MKRELLRFSFVKKGIALIIGGRADVKWATRETVMLLVQMT